jgi:hypothetical protein
MSWYKSGRDIYRLAIGKGRESHGNSHGWFPSHFIPIYRNPIPIPNYYGSP